jgi:hypothetical protein
MSLLTVPRSLCDPATASVKFSEPVKFNGIPRVAHAALRNAPDTWQRWMQFCEATEDDDFEMTCEEGAEMFAMVAKLVHLGVPFDDRFLARVDAMRQAMAHTQSDSDADIGVDDGQEKDDGDTDGADCYTDNGDCCLFRASGYESLPRRESINVAGRKVG